MYPQALGHTERPVLGAACLLAGMGGSPVVRGCRRACKALVVWQISLFSLIQLKSDSRPRSH